MWKVTLSGVLARKLRFILVGLAVVIGVAFMSGTLVLTDTIRRSFNDLFADINENTDAVVRGVEPYESDFEDVPRPPVPLSLLPAVRDVDGVEAAEPGVEIAYAQLVDKDGDEVGNPGTGPPSLGFSWSDNLDLNPMRLERGSRAPTADDEIVIDRASADKGDFVVGDTAKVLTSAPVKEYEIVGIAKFGTADSPLGASIVSFTLPEAQRIKGYDDVVSNIAVVAEAGVSEVEIRNRIAAVVTDDKLEVITGTELTEEAQSDIEDFVGFFETALLVFAVVALLVAMFIIFNTFSIIVAQRTRELALLRAIGASTRQVMTSVITEAIIIGLVASALGLGFGVLLAQGLKSLLNAFGLGVPGGGIVLQPNTVIAAFVVGIILTLLAALIPARRGSRVPPVAAMREVAIETDAGFGRRVVVGLAMLAVGVGALVFGLFASDSGLPFVGAGALIVLLAVFVLGPLIARPMSKLLGAPLPRTRGVAGKLARDNAVRNPKRTAATAFALVIGVALVGFITIFAASAKKSFAAAIDEQIKVDYVVTTGSGFGGIGVSPALAEEIDKNPVVDAATPIRFGPVEIDGEADFVVAAETATAEELFDFDVREGSLAGLTPDGIGVSRAYSDDNDVTLGDNVNMKFPDGNTAPLAVQAIYERDEIAASLIISLDAFEQRFPAELQRDFQIFVRLKPGITAAEGEAALEPLLEPYPVASLLNQAEYKEDQTSAIDVIVNIVYVLLFLAIVIAVIGIIITLLLSIFERTHELGLLRAVGMTRRQLRSAVRWESVIVALLGTILGLLVGLFFGWLVVVALRDEGFTDFAAAPGQLLIVVILAIIVGILAAIYPARRASRLDILRAIATE